MEYLLVFLITLVLQLFCNYVMLLEVIIITYGGVKLSVKTFWKQWFKKLCNTAHMFELE